MIVRPDFCFCVGFGKGDERVVHPGDIRSSKIRGLTRPFGIVKYSACAVVAIASISAITDAGLVMNAFIVKGSTAIIRPAANVETKANPRRVARLRHSTGVRGAVWRETGFGKGRCGSHQRPAGKIKLGT